MGNVVKGQVAFSIFGVYRCVVNVTVHLTEDGSWYIADENIIEQGCDFMDSTRGEMEYQDQLMDAVEELVADHRRLADMGDKIGNGATFMEA